MTLKKRKKELLKHLYFDINPRGIDYACGDVHGEIYKLQEAMNAVKFDPRRDRLFLVGDLVDKGRYSRRVYDLLHRPGVYSCLGNHDLNVIRFGSDPDSNWAKNWGGWFFSQNPVFREQIMTAMLNMMPVAMSVNTPNGLVGITHSGTPYNTWVETLGAIANAETNEDLRPFIFDRSYYEEKFDKLEFVSDLSMLISGHCPTVNRGVMYTANRYFIDTDGYKDDGEFVLMPINLPG